VKRRHQVVDRLPQLFPGRVHVLLEPGEFRVIRVFQVLDTPLEFRKAIADIIEFPIVVQLDADFCLANRAFDWATLEATSSTSVVTDPNMLPCLA
jgi:hypothetical protein